MQCTCHGGGASLYNEIVYEKTLKKKTKSEAYSNLELAIENETDKIYMKIIELYSNIDFNKFISKYVNNLEKNDDYYNAKLFQIEKKLDPKYFKNFECSVCYDNTKHKTICGHYLCVICYETMLLKKSFTCPLCRDDMREYICLECSCDE